MFALMHLDEFLQQTSNIRISRRNNRDFMVKEILETIDNFLQPVHDWLKYEGRQNYLPRMRDAQRFTMAELLEIYARISI